MKRILSGRLEHLPPDTLMRVLSAVAPSGVLSMETEAGNLQLQVVGGRVAAASDTELELAGRVLACSSGEFRFEPGEIESRPGITIPLTAYAEAAQSWAERKKSSFSSELNLERLMAGDLIDFSKPATSTTNIHVLPQAPLENPLDDLLSDLETNAPQEILFTQVGVIGSDPRLWRGTVEAEWRRRGWKLHQFSAPAAVTMEELDVLVVHHRLSITRVGHEHDWTDLIRRAGEAAPPVPVIWIGPLGDPTWVWRLIEAGVAFLIPAPPGESGETMSRFTGALTRVVDAQLTRRQGAAEADLPDALTELVENLLGETGPEQAVGSLLQLAAGAVNRGAILMVEETAIRCRAGFGYPLDRGSTALPRGVALLERVIRSGEAVVGIEPEAVGSRELARVLGVDQLPPATAVIPLGAGASVGGFLIVDCDGEPLPDLDELVVMVSRLGGVIVH
jgi:hypothetical protein